MAEICFSGGANGSDLAWGAYAKSNGHLVCHFSFAKHRTAADPSELIVLTEEQLAEADEPLRRANQVLKRKFPTKRIQTTNLLRRNWYQIENSSRVYAISTFVDDQIKGGTAWAVIMFIQRHDNQACEAYVFDQNNAQWYKWSPGWLPIDSPPMPHGQWTGIGTRVINSAGIRAIRDLFSKPKISGAT